MEKINDADKLASSQSMQIISHPSSSIKNVLSETNSFKLPVNKARRVSFKVSLEARSGNMIRIKSAAE